MSYKHGEQKNAASMHEAGNKNCFLWLQETLQQIWKQNSTHWANSDWRTFSPTHHGHIYNEYIT